MPTKSNTRNASPAATKQTASTGPRPQTLYVAALERENSKLQIRIAKLEAELVSAHNRIKALEEVKPEAVIRNLTDAELDILLEEKTAALGYVKAYS